MRCLFGLIVAVSCLGLGCGREAQDRFSPSARPIGTLLTKAINETNTSHLASLMNQAVEMERARMITPWDLKTIMNIESLGKGNEWKEAKALLDKAMRE